jgi:hypothetical protein
MPPKSHALVVFDHGEFDFRAVYSRAVGRNQNKRGDPYTQNTSEWLWMRLHGCARLRLGDITFQHTLDAKQFQ